LQAFGTIHHETLQKRILSPGQSHSKINALGDNHGRLDLARTVCEAPIRYLPDRARCMDIVPICLCCFGRGGSSMGWNLIGSSADVLMTGAEWHKTVFDGPTAELFRRLITGSQRRGLPVAPEFLQRALSPAYSKALKRKTMASVLPEQRRLKPAARHVVLKVMDYHIDLLPAIEAALGQPRLVVLTRRPEAQIESLLRSGLTLAQSCRWYSDIIMRMKRLLDQGAVHLAFEELVEDPKQAIIRLYDELGLAPARDQKYQVKSKQFGAARTAATDVSRGTMLALSLDELRGFIDKDVNRMAIARLSTAQIKTIKDYVMYPLESEVTAT
jgi:hypothetical protein